MEVRTPIAKARGLGPARAGLGHWKMLRLTSIANVLLVLWFMFSAMALSGSGYQQVRAWLASPLSASLMILLIICTFYHAHLGLQVVVEDYVHHEGVKLGSLAALALVLLALAVACIVAVLAVVSGG